MMNGAKTSGKGLTAFYPCCGKRSYLVLVGIDDLEAYGHIDISIGISEQ
jgi:hypothetical protein